MPTLSESLGQFGSGALDMLDMPGSYFRGALAGKAGERLSGSQLARSYGFDPGEGVGEFATDMALGLLDPTVLIPGGAALGLKAGKGVGGWLAANAAKRGPMYGTKIDDLIAMAPDKPMYHKLAGEVGFNSGITPSQVPDWQGWQAQLAKYPEIAREVPPGSVRIGGNTAESLIFHHPQTGQITKITSPRLAAGNLPEPRLDVADMLQPSRSKTFVKEGVPEGVFPSLRVEHEPFMSNIGNVPPPAFPHMAKHLSDQGVDAWDVYSDLKGYNPGNLGTTPAGKIMVTDAGAIKPGWHRSLNREAEIPLAPTIQGEASPLAAAILRLTGSGNRMQRQLAKAAKEYKGGSYGQPFAGTLDEMIEMAGMSKTPVVKPLEGEATPDLIGRLLERIRTSQHATKVGG